MRPALGPAIAASIAGACLAATACHQPEQPPVPPEPTKPTSALVAERELDASIVADGGSPVDVSVGLVDAIPVTPR